MNNETVESTTTTAGLVGFLVLFAMGLACWFLFRSMNKRLRGVRYREEAEQRAAEGGEAVDEVPEGDPIGGATGARRPDDAPRAGDQAGSAE